MEEKIRYQLEINKAREMKTPIILMNQEDFDSFKEEIKSKVQNFDPGEYPTYEGIPIKIHPFCAMGNVIIYDDIYPSKLKGKQKLVRSNFAINIVRTHFNEKFIEDLDWLSQNHIVDSHDSFPYISSLLSNIKEYISEYKDDIYCSFLLALYDSLVHVNSYLTVDSETYKRILKMIEFLNNKTLDYNLVDKYIFKLEEAGLNTTPY